MPICIKCLFNAPRAVLTNAVCVNRKFNRLFHYDTVKSFSKPCITGAGFRKGFYCFLFLKLYFLP